MSERRPNDYDVRVWGTKDKWVDIDLYQALQYARSDMGSGMQTLANDGTPEYQHVKALCDKVRTAMLDLDSFLRELIDKED